MKDKGYTHSSGKASAMEDHTYTKGNHHVTVSGWHGTGKGNRDYGGAKVIHAMYDSNHHSYQPVHEEDFTGVSDKDNSKNMQLTERGYHAHRALIGKIRSHLMGIK